MRRSVSAILAVLLLLAMTVPASADPGVGGPVIEADLNSVPIGVSQIPSFFCHDRDFPRIYCFTTARALERALAGMVFTSGLLTTAASDYVQIFAGTGTTGASTYLSQNYDTLALLGWNDRIRSYRGLNGASGVFWTDWFASGSALAFCCNVVDLSLPATFDRSITSVYRR